MSDFIPSFYLYLFKCCFVTIVIPYKHFHCFTHCFLEPWFILSPRFFPPNCSFLQTFCITSPHASAFLVYMMFFPSLFCSHPLSPDAAEFIYLFFLNHMRLRWPLRWQSRCKMWHSVYHGKNNTRVMSLRTLFWTYSSFELTDKREEASWVIGSFLK